MAAVAEHLRARGWAWDEPLLFEVAALLAAEGIADVCALRCVCLSDVAGSERWPEEVVAFVKRTIQVGLLRAVACVARHSCLQAVPVWHGISEAAPVCAPSASGVRLAAELPDAPTSLLQLSGRRPLQALESLRDMLPKDPVLLAQWRAKARVAAVMGSCPRSKGSFKSGLRHWCDFISITHGAENADTAAFPPCLGDVLAWSNTFRYVLLYAVGVGSCVPLHQVLWDFRQLFRVPAGGLPCHGIRCAAGWAPSAAESHGGHRKA